MSAAGRTSYRYYVFSGDRFATVEASLDDKGLAVDDMGSPRQLSAVPALAGLGHIDAVMNITGCTEQCTAQGKTRPSTFAVFSGSKFRVLTVPATGDLFTASKDEDSSLNVNRVDATLEVNGSPARWAFYGGDYEKIGAPQAQRIDGSASSVTESNCPSLSSAGIAP
ncbi:hypothetical protein [Streptomyces beigongshangae]|uniref:hypothetical protein n=1 Tax=Streptomyces beigongshangae TaxID=2841597 RepID=UPI001C85ED03|nr:hypothetical protein [Streptomyces sp. REN17]